MLSLRAIFAAVLVMFAATDALAALARESGLPLPRFASVRASEANMRTGPGLDYPIQWVLKRPGLPVLIVDEFHHWRQIRHWDGETGWVHRSMLTGRRTLRAQRADLLLSAPDEEATPRARIEPGAILVAEACDHAWCRVKGGRHSGFVERDAVWGLLDGEVLD